MSAVTLENERSDREVAAGERAPVREAQELSVAAHRLRASAGAPAMTDADLHSFMTHAVEALGDLETATTHVARRLGPHRQPFNRRTGMDLERRMHEFVSALAAARYSGDLARRELPPRSPR
jgi:Xaa-Pro aminopeptidase